MKINQKHKFLNGNLKYTKAKADSKEITISESYSLPLFGSFILNPEEETAFLVFGISF